jgi:nucleotide-binding universal stress UspA family protein
MLSRMLIPTDFSPCGQLAAGHAFDVARAFGGGVTLLHVLEPRVPSGDTPAGDAVTGTGSDDGTATALARLQQLGRLGRRPPTCLVVPALPGTHGVASVILRVAGEVGAELIVMGAHGVTDQHHPGIGQVVRQVVQGALVPVQVVPGALNIPHPGGRWRTLTQR